MNLKCLDIYNLFFKVALDSQNDKDIDSTFVPNYRKQRNIYFRQISEKIESQIVYYLDGQMDSPLSNYLTQMERKN